MVNKDKIEKMSVDDLYHYYGMLNSICGKYEDDLRPYFNPSTKNDVDRWNSIKNKLDFVSLYRNIVFEELKEKIINELS